MTKRYAAPQHIVRCFFEEARNVLRQAETAKAGGKNVSNKIAVIIVLVMAAVEAFLNSFFLIIAKEKKDEAFIREVETGETTVKEKRYRTPIEVKVREWPQRALGKSFDASTAVWQNFLKIKDHRNDLMHFKGGWHTVAGEGITLNGMHDNSLLGGFNISDGLLAIEAAENLIGEIGVLSGNNKEQFLCLWTEKIPE